MIIRHFFFFAFFLKLFFNVLQHKASENENRVMDNQNNQVQPKQCYHVPTTLEFLW